MATMTADGVEVETPIILLDLNYTLVGNSGDTMYDEQYEDEVYRPELVDCIRDLTVHLITVRFKKHERSTLRRIASQLDWQPDGVHFNEDYCSAPEWKEKVLKKRMLTDVCADPTKYLAIESNDETKAMYQREGVNTVSWQNKPLFPNMLETIIGKVDRGDRVRQ